MREMYLKDAQVTDVTGPILEAALYIHQELGPGLLESVYSNVMTAVLRKRGLTVQSQVAVSFEFDGMIFENQLRVDLLVNRIVVVELKSVETLLAVHPKQVLTYLRLMNLPVGLLINFGAPRLKDGFKRIVNNRFLMDGQTSCADCLP